MAPTVDVNPRDCQSANNKSSMDKPDSPDPLEAWSMKGITNMNKILAWEDQEDSTWIIYLCLCILSKYNYMFPHYCFIKVGAVLGSTGCSDLA